MHIKIGIHKYLDSQHSDEIEIESQPKPLKSNMKIDHGSSTPNATPYLYESNAKDLFINRTKIDRVKPQESPVLELLAPSFSIGIFPPSRHWPFRLVLEEMWTLRTMIRLFN
jgi:hypothetical protein